MGERTEEGFGRGEMKLGFGRVRLGKRGGKVKGESRSWGGTRSHEREGEMQGGGGEDEGWRRGRLDGEVLWVGEK